LYYFSEVANGTTSYVIWSNETHHTQGVDLIGTGMLLVLQSTGSIYAESNNTLWEIEWPCYQAI